MIKNLFEQTEVIIQTNAVTIRSNGTAIPKANEWRMDENLLRGKGKQIVKVGWNEP